MVVNIPYWSNLIRYLMGTYYALYAIICGGRPESDDDHSGVLHMSSSKLISVSSSWCSKLKRSSLYGQTVLSGWVSRSVGNALLVVQGGESGFRGKSGSDVDWRLLISWFHHPATKKYWTHVQSIYHQLSVTNLLYILARTPDNRGGGWTGIRTNFGPKTPNTWIGVRTEVAHRRRSPERQSGQKCPCGRASWHM